LLGLCSAFCSGFVRPSFGLCSAFVWGSRLPAARPCAHPAPRRRQKGAHPCSTQGTYSRPTASEIGKRRLFGDRGLSTALRREHRSGGSGEGAPRAIQEGVSSTRVSEAQPAPRQGKRPRHSTSSHVMRSRSERESAAFDDIGWQVGVFGPIGGPDRRDIGAGAVVTREWAPTKQATIGFHRACVTGLRGHLRPISGPGRLLHGNRTRVSRVVAQLPVAAPSPAEKTAVRLHRTRVGDSHRQQRPVGGLSELLHGENACCR